MEQLTDAKIHLLQKDGRVRIELNPPEMGSLQMDLMVRDDRVDLVMKASSPDVQHLLRTHVDELKALLQRQGLQVERCEVQLQFQTGDGGRGFPGNASFDRGQGEGHRPFPSPGSAQPPAPGAVSPVRREAVFPPGRSGISVFA